MLGPSDILRDPLQPSFLFPFCSVPASHIRLLLPVPGPLPSWPPLTTPTPQTTSSHVLDACHGEGRQGAGRAHALHHGPQGPAGGALDELAGVPNLLQQAAGDCLSLLVHVLLQSPEKVSQGSDGQAGHLGAEVGDLGEKEKRDPLGLLDPDRDTEDGTTAALQPPCPSPVATPKTRTLDQLCTNNPIS